ncbi:gliding motility-associated C-terminal domain-containing protein [Ferruginibacter paludis]|uniref:T9SS type B sorting domain-containing protein n=1 Tax=Ferruginibacter paludis TaxID=1310417 RepID=UPI0025B4E8D2|nr:gliding motility-associated C-terminal domain-containing protein [Ferruginibacter paludis]MDN3657813.1 gliding motility-associated C-terminal domain-containing protein [Ferruginibacter paludis]
MKNKFCLIYCLLIYFNASATTYIVISNADSGPGSLREAMTFCNSNGIIGRDSIAFAIPSTTITARTITLLSALPKLSSNMVIYGASQPGSSIGVSDAKVVLLLTNNGVNFSFLDATDCSDVGIYGIAMVSTFANDFVSPVTAITYLRCHNLQIGKAGAGNYILGCARALYCNTGAYYNFTYSDTSRQLTLQSNIIGLDEEGGFSNTYQSQTVPPIYLPIYIISTADILFGGDKPGEGNTIAMSVNLPYPNYSVTGNNVIIETCRDADNGYLVMKNNKFGTKKDGSWPPPTGPMPIFIYIPNNFYTDYEFKFINNVLQGQLLLNDLGKYFYIQGNTIFAPYVNTVYDASITLTNNYGGGIVGGDSAYQTNTIYNNYTDPIYYFNNYATFVASIRVDAASQTTIRNNVTYCNRFAGSSIISYNYNGSINPNCWVRIDSMNTNIVKGKASPNSRIDVYLDDDCLACEGKKFLGFTLSNPDSSWQYTGTFSGTVVATATSGSGQTSEFSTPGITDYYVKVKQPNCSKKNGSIKGLLVSGNTNVKWHLLKQVNGVWKDSLYATTVDLDSAGPGIYIFDAWIGNTCRGDFKRYDLYDLTPKLNTSLVSLQNPTCGQSNGFVKNITINTYQDIKISWIDASGTVVGDQLDLIDVFTGQYKLIVKDTVSGCSDSTGFYTLINQSGPSINTINIAIKPSTCGKNNGSITGIVAINVSGTPFYQWIDSLNNPVGNTPNLSGIYKGKYALKFKDQSSCDTIQTPYFTVTDNGDILIDTASELIIASKCSANTGSIQQIKVTNGEVFTWKNTATNTLTGNALDIFSQPPGNYELSVSNHYGCSATSPQIAIPPSNFLPIGVTAYTSKDGLCLRNNGSITINNFSSSSSMYTFNWIDSVSGIAAGTGTSVSNLAAGTYQLFATDSNGCTNKIFSDSIKVLPVPVFDYSQEQITNDVCNLHQGSIASIKINGLTGPSTYTWQDQNNNIVGNTLQLSNIGAGNYILEVHDAGVCTFHSNPIMIVNADSALALPQYDSLVIPRYSSANIVLKNPTVGSYQLMANLSGQQILQQNSSGNFNVANIAADTSFYVLVTNGTCSSSIARVFIKVVDKSFIVVPTAFTPNNDGKNDFLSAKSIGYIQLDFFRVFNKWGELVFETHQLNNGWNGRYKSRVQNTGSYIWFAEGRDINGNVVSAKGMTTLIR